jgi:hypothetical protein
MLGAGSPQGAIGQKGLGHGVRLELVCGSCGYGVVVNAPPEQCPMCRAASWQAPTSDPADGAVGLSGRPPVR